MRLFASQTAEVLASMRGRAMTPEVAMPMRMRWYEQYVSGTPRPSANEMKPDSACAPLANDATASAVAGCTPRAWKISLGQKMLVKTAPPLSPSARVTLSMKIALPIWPER